MLLQCSGHDVMEVPFHFYSVLRRILLSCSPQKVNTICLDADLDLWRWFFK